jgi:hypothetical protein
VALGSLPERHGGLAAGVNDTFRNTGIALGVAVFGALVPAAAAVGHGSPAAYVDGLRHALFVAAGVAAVGAIASARLIGVRSRHSALVAAGQEPLEVAAPAYATSDTA